MPIRMQATQGSKEQPSKVSFGPIQSPVLELFRESFEIPESIPVEGMLFADKGTIYNTLVDNELLHMFIGNGIYRYSGGPIQPTEFQLPPVFEDGTQSVAMADGYLHDHFQSVLRFNGVSNIPIHYQTPPEAHDDIWDFVFDTAIMACLPKEVLQKVKESDHPMAVIHQNVHRNGEYTGYDYSTVYTLLWDEQAQLIQASKIQAKVGGESYREDQALACKNAVAKSQSVFFVSN